MLKSLPAFTLTLAAFSSVGAVMLLLLPHQMRLAEVLVPVTSVQLCEASSYTLPWALMLSAPPALALIASSCKSLPADRAKAPPALSVLVLTWRCCMVQEPS